MKLKLYSVGLNVHDSAGSPPAGASQPAAPSGEGAGAKPETKAGSENLPGSGRRAGAGGKEQQPKVVYGRQADDGGAGEAPAAGEQKEEDGSSATHNTAEGAPEARKARFEELIRGEFKDAFAERVQSIIDRRFKEFKTLQERFEAVRPVLDLLGRRYGVPDADPAKIAQALEGDYAMLEELAEKAGMTVDQYRQFLKLERENRQLKEEREREKQERERAEMNARLAREEEAVKKIYPSFSMLREISETPGFAQLIAAGIDARTAFEVCHRDEIFGGLIQAAGRRAEETVVRTIQAKGARPSEAGAAPAPNVVVKDDVSKLTREDRLEIARRVRAGERIAF